MAKIFPQICPSNSPPGEKLLFRRLRIAPGSEAWIVLHSLLLPKHLKQAMGEVDFVVLVPRFGIVCLEVKSHTRIKCGPEGWMYGDALKIGKDPFQQAVSGMHTIRNWLISADPSCASIPFAYGVSFPCLNFDAAAIEWESWQILDRRATMDENIVTAIEKLIRLTTRECLNSAKGIQVNPDSLSASKCEKIALLLRPQFEVIHTHQLLRDEHEAELLRLTEQQYSILDAVASNPRILMNGPAGTGKTVLANEIFRRKVEAGYRVAYLTYNRNLADVLNDTLSCPTGSLVTSIDAWLVQITAGCWKSLEKHDESFFDSALPEMALNQILANGNFFGKFDFLVVDEGQDLLKECYLDIFDLVLDRGLREGRWLIGGDFDHQKLYSKGSLSLENFRERHAPEFTTVSLTKNCRNTPAICSFIGNHTPLKNLYASRLREDDFVDPELVFYDSEKEQSSWVAEHIRDFISKGVPQSDIVILSPRKDACAALRLVGDSSIGFILKPYGRSKRSAVRYSTIHGFKGLEAYAVVVTDIDSVSEAWQWTLLYVAMTRAQSRLSVFCHRRIKSDMKKILKS